MDRARYSFIAHAGLTYWNPIGEVRMDRALREAPLPPGGQVLDIGAGTGELMLRLIERHSVRATAIERESVFVDEMRRRADDRVPPGALEVVEGDAGAWVNARAPESFDAVFCIGAIHALGDYRTALASLTPLVRPGGTLVIGHGYWKRPPEAAYLDSFGGSADEHSTHDANVAAGLELGLVPRFATTASDDEWDEYEWRYATNMEDYLASHPEDPDHAAMLERCRSWREGYLRWGRETMGFGLYVFTR